MFPKKKRRTYATSEDFEICVLCGKKTNIKCELPINPRAGYIEGCGQLCEDCQKMLSSELHENYGTPMSQLKIQLKK